MIVWLNGAFGAGKTTVTRELRELLPDALVFDPEWIGASIRPTLGEAFPVADFQDWPVWREGVVSVLAALDRFASGRVIIAPQTVLVEQYWRELEAGIAGAGAELRAFTLDVAPGEHERRIAADEVEADAAEWRRSRASDFSAALPWLRTVSRVIDTTALAPREVAERIAASL